MQMDTNRLFGGIPVGVHIRGQLAKTVIFRVRRGNGRVNSIKGKLYQDQYPYFVPSTINNPQSDYVRAAFAAAVAIWKTEMTETEKNVYRKKANRRGGMSGYNLFISNYVRRNI